MTRTRPAYRAVLFSATLALAALAPAGGCYEHTVAAKGYGADRVDVYKANAPRDGETINGRRKIEHRSLD